MDRSPPPSKGSSPPDKKRRILVVEDDRDMRVLLERMLFQNGWSASFANDGLTALQYLEVERFDAVLADLRIPGPDGIRVLEHARVCSPSALLVIYSGWVTQEARSRAEKIGAVVITKGAIGSRELFLTILES